MRFTNSKYFSTVNSRKSTSINFLSNTNETHPNSSPIWQYILHINKINPTLHLATKLSIILDISWPQQGLYIHSILGETLSPMGHDSPTTDCYWGSTLFDVHIYLYNMCLYHFNYKSFPFILSLVLKLHSRSLGRCTFPWNSALICLRHDTRDKSPWWSFHFNPLHAKFFAET